MIICASAFLLHTFRAHLPVVTEQYLLRVLGQVPGRRTDKLQVQIRPILGEGSKQTPCR